MEKRWDVFLLKEEPSRNTAPTQTGSVTSDLSEHYLLMREFTAFKHLNNRRLSQGFSDKWHGPGEFYWNLKKVGSNFFTYGHWEHYFSFLNPQISSRNLDSVGLIEPGNLYFCKSHRHVWKSCQSNLYQGVHVICS